MEEKREEASTPWKAFFQPPAWLSGEELQNFCSFFSLAKKFMGCQL